MALAWGARHDGVDLAYFARYLTLGPGSLASQLAVEYGFDGAAANVRGWKVVPEDRGSIRVIVDGEPNIHSEAESAARLRETERERPATGKEIYQAERGDPGLVVRPDRAAEKSLVVFVVRGDNAGMQVHIVHRTRVRSVL